MKKIVRTSTLIFFLAHLCLLFCPSLAQWDPIEKYESVSKTGLSKCSVSPTVSTCKTIVVVGGGVAGLVAAHALQEAGHKVIVLEANSRTGGRILTHCTDLYGCVDLGAMRIPDSHNLTKDLVEKFNLNTSSFVMENDNAFVYVNSVKSSADADPDLLGFDVAPHERGMTAGQLWDNAVSPVLKEIDEHGWDYVVKKYDNLSVKGYLDSIGLSPGAMNMIGVMLDEQALYYTSFTESIRDQTVLTPETQFYKIVGGTSKLIESLEASLQPGTIQLNCSVTKITQLKTTTQFTSATVYYRNPDGVEQSITADNVIITATARATSLIGFHPELPSNKALALRNVHYDSATKIALYFDRKFWELDDGICGGYSVTDQPSRFTWYLTNNLASCADNNGTTGGIVLASYTWSDDSLLFSGLSDEDCMQVALNDLALYHGDSIKQYFKGGIVKKWSNDPYSLGGFALFTPTQERDLEEALCEPFGLVHFAGEYSSHGHGWIEGAVYSAWRAAVAVNNQPETYDVVGLATGIECAKLGQKVLVMDPKSFGNQLGSSAGMTRQFREMYSEEYLAQMAADSVKYWRRLEIEANAQEGSLLHQDGYLFFGTQNTGDTTEGNFKSIQKTCESLKMNCTELSKDAIQAQFGFTNLPHDYMGLFHPQSGYIDVNKTMEALYQLAKSSGVTLREFELVSELVANEKENSFHLITNKLNNITASKIMLAPGPYANDVFKMLNFEVDMTIWELPSVYFRVIQPDRYIPTWFVFGGDDKSLFYGFPHSDGEADGYVRVAPDFVQTTLKSPSERTNVPDWVTVQHTVQFVSEHIPWLNASDYFVPNATCLIGLLPNNGFILSNAPKTVPLHKNIVICAGGWAFKFVPLFGHLAATLLVEQSSDGYDLGPFEIDQYLKKASHPSSHIWWIILAVVGSVVLVALIVIVVAVVLWRRRDPDAAPLLDTSQ